MRFAVGTWYRPDSSWKDRVGVDSAEERDRAATALLQHVLAECGPRVEIELCLEHDEPDDRRPGWVYDSVCFVDDVARHRHVVLTGVDRTVDGHSMWLAWPDSDGGAQVPCGSLVALRVLAGDRPPHGPADGPPDGPIGSREPRRPRPGADSASAEAGDPGTSESGAT